MHRFFIAPDQIGGGRVRFRPDQAHQIGRVLRLRPGDTVLALDGRAAYTVVLETVTREAAAGRIRAEAPPTGEPRTHLILYQSLLKRDKFEWVLQKGTEIGVSRFVPVISRRTLVRDAETVTPEKLGRWERIITEAAEQSGRGALPHLTAPLSFAAALDEAASIADRTLIAWEGAAPGDLSAALDGSAVGVHLALFIGPEGGYEAAEIAQAQSAGARVISLGPRTLRTETAAVVGAALILYALGDLSA